MARNKKWEIERRTVLRGLGAMISLPLMEAMLPSLARAQSAGDLPTFISIDYPLGYLNEGNEMLTQGLRSSLSPITGKYSVARGYFSHCESTLSGSLNGGHMVNFIATRVSSPVYQQADISISFDQVIAQSPQYKGKRKIDSLNMSNFAHFGYTDGRTGPGLQEVAHNPSWLGPNQPTPLSFQPREVFRQLVGVGVGGRVDNTLVHQKKRDVLHYAMEDIKALRARLGKSDNEVLDRHLTNIEEADKRTQALQAQDGQLMAQCRTVAEPKQFNDHTSGNGGEMSQNYIERLRLFQDLMIMALECDLVSTMTFSYSGSFPGNVRPKEFIPGLETVQENNPDWHAFSHYNAGSGAASNVQGERKRNFVRVSEWVHADYAAFVKRIEDIQLPNGQTLLNKCGIILSSGMGNHNLYASHPPNDLMAIIAGTANGRLNVNQMIKDPNDRASIAKLWLTLIKAFGVNASSFGKGAGQSNQTVAGISNLV